MTKYAYDSRTRTFEKLSNYQYIYQRSNGWFEIRKRIGGVLVYWGSFPTLNEALLYRAYYIGMNWNVNPAFKENRYITRKKDKYIIMKEHNGIRQSYGVFNDLESARHERDVCLSCDWDYDRICEWVD